MMSAEKMVKFLNGCEAKETVQICLEHLKPSPEESEIALHENILEILIDAVSDAEVGLIEFLRKGGLNLCLNYINGVNTSLRLRACRLIAEVTQNNPPAQDLAFKTNLLPSLMKLTDSEMELKHSMSAISAIVRGHQEAFMYFVHNGGHEFILKGLQSENEQIVKKFAFFLSAGYASYPALKSDIRAVGVVPVLLKKIDEAVEANQELLISFLLEALISIVDDDNRAIEECQLAEYKLRENLKICKENYPFETYSSVTEHAEKLIKNIFNGTVDDKD